GVGMLCCLPLGPPHRLLGDRADRNGLSCFTSSWPGRFTAPPWVTLACRISPGNETPYQRQPEKLHRPRLACPRSLLSAGIARALGRLAGLAHGGRPDC